MNIHAMNGMQLAKLYFTVIAGFRLNQNGMTYTFNVAWGTGKVAYKFEHIQTGILDIEDSISRIINAARNLTAQERVVFEMGTGITL
ncbi:hypothetical protein [Aeromonas jandaei]|uniref:hypothetical protein n=1 Tax=Aeromonas jandaei TaxID=650 RepID=UPI003B9E159A